MELLLKVTFGVILFSVAAIFAYALWLVLVGTREVNIEVLGGMFKLNLPARK